MGGSLISGVGHEAKSNMMSTRATEFFASCVLSLSGVGAEFIKVFRIA